MSASTPRGQRGGTAFRGGRGSSSSTQPIRGNTKSSSTRGRGRGRGASVASAASAPTSTGQGLLQQLRTGTLARGSANVATTSGRGRGTPRASTTSTPRGRGHLTKVFNAPARPASAPTSRSSSPAPLSSMKDFMDDSFARFQVLKQERDLERAKAIKDGFLADPEKKTTLDKAITPVGTSTDMCPEFERVERIVQNMVDKSEKIKDEQTGRDMPSEPIMVKRFRRSAAGYDEQLPSDIRTPATLKRTMDYLVDQVVGGPERLAVVHKFVWDRTRAIRNDFSIQQVSKEEDVTMAVDCYERIARFHILSMHQLCNEDNLHEGENFDFFQEREQLNNTLLSLMYYYDDNHGTINFPNEAEFRAYCIIFEIQSQQPDLEDRIQSWPLPLLQDKKVEAALKLYRTSGNTVFEQGPLRPMIPYSMAQNNTGSFWTILASSAVPYLMACVAEIYLAYVRFACLDALWKSGKSAPQVHQAKAQDWNLDALTDHLGFDEDQQTVEFCRAFDLDFARNDVDEVFLDFSAYSPPSLDKSKIPRQQKFSHTFVEDKRCRRNLVAIVNGLTVSQAIHEGMVEEEESSDDDHIFRVEEPQDDGESFFLPDTNNSFGSSLQPKSPFGSGLNPQAPAFTVTKKFGENISPQGSTKFGNAVNPSLSTKFGEGSALTQNRFSSSQPKSESTAATSGVATSSISQPPVPAAAIQPFATNRAEDFATQVTPNSSWAFGSSSFNPPAPHSASPIDTVHLAKADPIPEKSRPAPGPTAQTSFGKFDFSKPTEAVSVPSTFTSPTTNFSTAFTPSAPFTQVSQAPLPAASDLSPLKAEPKTPLQFGVKPQASSATPNPEPSMFSGVPVAPRGQKPLSQPPIQPPTSTPVFNFNQPRQFQAPSEPSVAPDTIVPEPSPQSLRPQLSDTREPHLGITQSQNKVEAHKQPQITFQQPAKIAKTTSTTSVPDHPSKAPGPAPKQSTTPPTSPRSKPDVSSIIVPDKSQLIHTLANLSICQQGGLLQEFLEYTLPKMLKGIFKTHIEREQHAKLDRLKVSCLQRKYGILWKKITWRNTLHRKAKIRRQRFSELLSQESEKRKKLEMEKNEIIKAVEEKKRLQAELAEQKTNEKFKSSERLDVQERQDTALSGQVAGMKRKSLNDSAPKEASNVAPPEASYRNHKRSRTLGSAMPPPPKPSSLSPSPRSASQGFRFSNTSLSSGLNRSYGVRSFGKLPHRSSQDTTKTDFFRLLAHGVDPETPWVPLTAPQVGEKKKREEMKRTEQVEAAYNRRRVGTSAKKVISPVPASSVPDSSEAGPPVSSPAPSASSLKSETDDLILQMREAQKQMVEDTEWLKTENERLQKEMQQEEKLRSSVSSIQSGRTSRSGLPIVNGYEYYPAPELPSGSMSRVERRIRATGARGFASRPISGDNSTRLTAPLSKKTPNRHQHSRDEMAEDEANGTARKRRKHGGFDRTYKPTGEDELTEEEQELEYLPAKRSKGSKFGAPASHSSAKIDQSYRPAGEAELDEEERRLEFATTKPLTGARHVRPAPRSKPATGKMSVELGVREYRSNQGLVPQEDEEDEYLEEDMDETHLFYHNDEDGDTEELDDEGEELLEEDSEEEALEYEDEDELQVGYLESGMRARSYDDAPTPNTQASHVSSGLGATAEDPLELSD